MKVKIDGKEYRVVENLGFVRGAFKKVIELDGRERIVEKVGGKWKLAEPVILAAGQWREQS